MACRESLSESLVGVVFKWARGSCRGLVGCLVGLPCRIFWRRDTFLKDVSYESLVGELFLEESLVGSCRTGFLAQVFFN